VSISLPEELLKRVDEAANKNKITRSEFIAKILEGTLGSEEEIKKYPTVLWKLQKSGYLKLRSPKHPSRRIGGWIVEELEE
jgi:metal-responsive CopG/Arc/MetJ family transcriptional regulator